MITVLLLGDFNSESLLHHATYAALHHAADTLGLHLSIHWIETSQAHEVSIKGADGMLIAPGGPYAYPGRVLDAIRYARERHIPLLGTCGGFQHIVLEHAHHILGRKDAAHAESNPEAETLFISKLDCSLAGRSLEVALHPKSIAHRAYGSDHATERYYCNFGINPTYTAELEQSGLTIVGRDSNGEPRIVERKDHPFFVGTLFVPQARSKPGEPHPLLVAWLSACIKRSTPVWIDIDVIVHDIAKRLGIIPSQLSFTEAKHLYWTANPTEEHLINIIESLKVLKRLEAHPDDETLLRWMPPMTID